MRGIIGLRLKKENEKVRTKGEGRWHVGVSLVAFLDRTDFSLQNPLPILS